MMSKNLYNLALLFHVYCLCSIGCLKSSFRFYIVFCVKHLMLLWANVHWFRKEIYLNNLSKEFQTKNFEKLQYFWSFSPDLHVCEFFPPHFPAHFVGFLNCFFFFCLAFSFIFSITSRKRRPTLFVL